MAARGRIRRRLALALVLTALIPVCVAIALSRSMVRQTAERFFQPEIGQRLDESLELYRELASTLKARMRADTEAMAADPELGRALEAPSELSRVLAAKLERYADLAELGVQREEEVLASADRGRPLDEEREFALHVEQPIADTDAILVAVFATDRARFDQLREMSSFVDTYAQVEGRREQDERTYVYAFAALLGLTIVLAVGVGSLLAVGVSRRLGKLALAIEKVGAGDLRLRVEDDGNDEIAELARAFNQMLGEVEASRGRIEYLSRIAAWQGMAQRLAHEIKNPLTPIQLAVQEMHQRYKGQDEDYRQIVDTTLEVVEAEVGTLRRLVTEFSDFARLPRAELADDDLYDFLRSQRETLTRLDPDAGDERRIALEIDVPAHGTAPVRLDRQMMRRVLINLVRNAAQAIGDGPGRIRVRAAPLGKRRLELAVEDDGPGVPQELRERIFDPYVTHKPGGTGLGLAIAKKVIVEHEGAIEVSSSPLGGARMSIVLPARPPLADGHASLGPDSTAPERRALERAEPHAADLAK